VKNTRKILLKTPHMLKSGKSAIAHIAKTFMMMIEAEQYWKGSLLTRRAIRDLGSID